MAVILRRGVKISEIMYNPCVSQGKDAYNEWVILHNTLNSPVNLSGWTLGGDKIIGDSRHGNGTLTIPAHGYAIVTDLNTRVYEHFMVNANFVRLQINDDAITPYGLNNRGDEIVLQDANGNVIDDVKYSPSWGGNGDGHTIVMDNGTWEESKKVCGSLWAPGKVEISEKIYLWATGSARYHVPYYSIKFNVTGDGSVWEVYTILKEQGDEWFDEGSMHVVSGNQETQYPANKKYSFTHVESYYGENDPDSAGHLPSDWVTDYYPHSGYTVNPYKDYKIKLYAVNVNTKENYTSFFDVAPLNKDSDGDGLSDVEETAYYSRWYPGINPDNNDSDGDSWSDWDEIINGTNPVSKYSHPGYLFMFYIDADNILSDVPLKQKIEDFENISNLGKNVWVTALYDTYSEDTYQYYYGSSSYKKDMGEKDMSDPDTLINFAKWSIQNYGGTHTVLVIYGHGDSWRGLLEDDTPNEGSRMSISQLKYAMNKIKNAIGKSVDITVFDACYMSSMEVAYELRGTTNIIVASAESKVAMTPNGYAVWPYKNIIQDMINYYKLYSKPDNLAKNIVNKFGKEIKNINDKYGTIVAFDENMFYKYLFLNFTQFANLLYSKFDYVKDTIKKGIENKNPSNAQSPRTEIPFYGRDSSGNRVIRYFDVADFVSYIGVWASNHKLANLTNISQTILDYMIYDSIFIDSYVSGGQEYQNTIIYGLSIYIYDYSDDDYYFDGKYTSTDFAKDTKWDDFIIKAIDYMNN